MRWAAPALCGLALSLGCAREPAPDGATLLGMSHRAEASLFYRSREVNEQVMAEAWPTRAVPGRPASTRVYGRPITTFIERRHQGPRQKVFKVLSTNAPGARAAGMVIAQNGTEGWRYLPSVQRLDMLTFPATDVGPLNWLALVLANYDVRDVRRDRVVGAPAWHLRLHPRQPFRPSKRLWLDAETGLSLRQELWGPDGRLLSTTQVVERPEPIPARPDTLPMPDVRQTGGVRVVQGDQEWLVSRDGLRASLGHPLGRLGYVPDGFMETGAFLCLGAGNPVPSARWELTDGVATVNVIQTIARDGSLEGLEMPQDTQGALETARRGPYLFILRGNIGAPELRRIADGITMEDPGL